MGGHDLAGRMDLFPITGRMRGLQRGNVSQIHQRLAELGADVAIAGVAALMGKSQVSKAAPPVPEQTVQSVKADVEEVKERAHR